MKYKFNPFERSVGIFIALTMIGTLVTGLGIALKRNWFEEKISFATFVESGDNIRKGSSVYIKGLKVGNIEDVELDPSGVKVTFSILKRYSSVITEGSKAKFLRSFVIGEKTLIIDRGPSNGPVIAAGSSIPSEKVIDVMDLLSGENIQGTFVKLNSILGNLDETLIVGKDIALQLSDKKRLKVTIDNIAYASSELRKVLPVMLKKAPHVGQNMEQIVQNMTVITEGLKELRPVMSQMASSFPEGSKQTMELLNESIIVLQAMQKSFLLKGNVEEVKSERTKRVPASTP